MIIKTEHLNLSTQGENDCLDISSLVQQKLKTTGLKNGIVNINVCGSTAGLTTLEFEPGLIQDLGELMNRLIPKGPGYHHDEAWNDGNGHAHLRSAVVGASLTLPFSDGKMVLGQWQQIVLVDFDNRPRQRKLVLQFLGE